MSDTDTRDRLITAAAGLLAGSAGEPVSTRAICAAAGVGAPTLYHHFGDKQGLFDAVVARGFEQYLASRPTRVATADPVADLRVGWDTHVEFGLTNPAIYTLMYGLGQGRRPPAAAEAHRILTGMLDKVAIAGRLAIPVGEAADMVDAAGVGVTLALIAAGARNLADVPLLSTRTRDAVLAAVTTDAPTGSAGMTTTASLAIALDAAVAEPGGPLTAAEVALLREWLLKLVSTGR